MLRKLPVILITVAVCYCFWFFGLGRSVDDGCPEQTLTPEQVETLYENAEKTLSIDQMGEYHYSGSIDKAVPMFERAARHGHRKSINRLSSLFITAGIVEMTGIHGYSELVTAEIGMMWRILGVHLGDPVKVHDQETYQVLLDPKVPFPKGFFQISSGTAWMFQMMTRTTLHRAREQAYAWGQCWPSENSPPSIK